MNEVAEWAARHGVDANGIVELLRILTMPPENPTTPVARSEMATQADIRLRAPAWGGMLWRNNTGVLKDDSGTPVRFGLANDSAKLNKHVKSADLIGFMPRIVGAADVGLMLPVFTAVECKRGGWTWGGNVREVAQQRFLNIVKVAGGVAGFAQSVSDFDSIMRGER